MNASLQSSIRFVLFASGVTAIGGFLFGYDTAVINGANSYLKAWMHLTPLRKGLAGASAILGCIPGAMFAGLPERPFRAQENALFLRAALRGLRACSRPFPERSSNSWRRVSSAAWASGLPR